jgi:DNA-binding MarR family transcriptional regulator
MRYDHPVNAARIDPDQPSSPGVRAWDLMSRIWKSCKPYLEEVSASFSMTPQQVVALKVLGENGKIAMSELALHLGCDASNVTSIVDKLETRGLVERRSTERDRRVKVLLLTAEGQALYGQVSMCFKQPPPVIDNLAVADQEALCAIFGRALAGTGLSAVRPTIEA